MAFLLLMLLWEHVRLDVSFTTSPVLRSSQGKAHERCCLRPLPQDLCSRGPCSSPPLQCPSPCDKKRGPEPTLQCVWLLLARLVGVCPPARTPFPEVGP